MLLLLFFWTWFVGAHLSFPAEIRCIWIVCVPKATDWPLVSSSDNGNRVKQQIHLYEYPYYSPHYSITINSTIATPWFDISLQASSYLPVKERSNDCASLCWARGNQEEIYEHNNESYACFNYNNPDRFEVCCCPLYWTDKHGSRIKFACCWEFFYYFLMFVSIAVNKLQQKELNCRLCLHVYYRENVGSTLTFIVHEWNRNWTRSLTRFVRSITPLAAHES